MMIKNRVGWIFAAVIIATLCILPSCSQKAKKNHAKKLIVVTIPPLQGIVKQVVGDDYEVSVLLPMGSSPESYSPTPAQIVNIEQAELVFCIGTLDFEQVIMERFARQGVDNLVDCSEGVALIEGGCVHGHHAKHNVKQAQHAEKQTTHTKKQMHHTDNQTHHHHGIDPHIWLSPYELEVVAENVRRAICTRHPDSAKYMANSEQLIYEIRARQNSYGIQLARAGAKNFLIYHPALGYLARDYGLEQISLEHEGKAPTPAAIANIAERLTAEGVKPSLLYQAEYPEEVVKPLAEILDVKLVQINPLNNNILTELDAIINTISTTENGAN